MDTKTIIEQEKNNEDTVYLLKEGIFWRAYNQSAMRLINHLKSLKITSRYIKKVKQEIQYCGFPENSLNEVKKKAIEKGYLIEKSEDKKIVISGFNTNDNYNIWKEQQNLVKEPEVQYTKRSDTGDIIRQIKEYPIISKTPVEAFSFLADIQKQLYKLSTL